MLFIISIDEWQSISCDRNAWRQALYQGKYIFLSSWWKNWFKKYNARRQGDKTVSAKKVKFGISNNSDSLLEQILFKDELIPKANKIENVRNDIDVSIVKRITEVNSCLEDMFPKIIQEYQFDLLEQEISSGRINVDRAKNRKRN